MLGVLILGVLASIGYTGTVVYKGLALKHFMKEASKEGYTEYLSDCSFIDTVDIGNKTYKVLQYDTLTILESKTTKKLVLPSDAYEKKTKNTVHLGVLYKVKETLKFREDDYYNNAEVIDIHSVFDYAKYDTTDWQLKYIDILGYVLKVELILGLCLGILLVLRYRVFRYDITEEIEKRIQNNSEE